MKFSISDGIKEKKRKKKRAPEETRPIISPSGNPLAICTIKDKPSRRNTTAVSCDYCENFSAFLRMCIYVSAYINVYRNLSNKCVGECRAVREKKTCRGPEILIRLTSNGTNGRMKQLYIPTGHNAS